MKFRNLLWSFTTLLALSACDSEFDIPDLNTEGDEEVVVTYTVKLPEAVQTRAFSDGTKATNLHYAVYEVVQGEEESLQLSLSDNVLIKARILYEDDDDVDTQYTELGADVPLRLIKGKTYEIAFWAQSANAPFSYKDKTRIVTYDYENAVANNDNLDAFYAYERAEVKCDVGKSIILNRALAQINFGSNDIPAARRMGLRVDRSTIKMPAYSKFNLKTGEVSEPTTMQFRLADVPSDEEFPFIKEGEETSEYSYVAMGYVFVPSDQTQVDITLIVDSEDAFTADFKNIPVQRNYRTNIFGPLFTNIANYDVILNERYRGEDYNVSIWDGFSTESKAPVNGVIEIENAAQLARIAERTNGILDGVFVGEDDWQAYQGVTLKLETDIDLAHLHWTSIASADINEYVFLGNIDGNGHKIKNIHVDASTGAAGFIGCIGSDKVHCSIKNLTLENVIIDNAPTTEKRVYDGALVGYARNTTIENVTITGDIIINGADEVGGVIGHALDCEISNITVDASEGSLVKATGAYAVGSIAGYSYEPLNNVSSNLDVQAESTTSTTAHVGGLVGVHYYANNATYEDCSYSGNVYLYNHRAYTPATSETEDTPNPYNMTIGGLIGSYYNPYTNGGFKNCSFTGTIHSYWDGADKTSAWSANSTCNPYWEYVGWHDAGKPALGPTVTISE